MSSLPSAVLGMEAFLMLLLLPAVAKSGNGPLVVRTVLVALLLVCLVVAVRVVRRRRHAGVVLGWVLQGALIACGLLTWPMYVLGAMFAGLWAVAVHLSRPTD